MEGAEEIINRRDFERYLINHEGCSLAHGDDTTLMHQGHYATFGNHARRQVHQGEARGFLRDLGFADNEINRIMQNF